MALQLQTHLKVQSMTSPRCARTHTHQGQGCSCPLTGHGGAWLLGSGAVTLGGSALPSSEPAELSRKDLFLPPPGWLASVSLAGVDQEEGQPHAGPFQKLIRPCRSSGSLGSWTSQKMVQGQVGKRQRCLECPMHSPGPRGCPVIRGGYARSVSELVTPSRPVCFL